MAISDAASAGSYIAVGIIMPLLCIIVVGLRMWAKRLSTRKLNLDDYLILFATVVIIALGIILLVGSANGYLTQRIPLHHSKEFYINYTNPKLVTGQKLEWASEIMQTLTFGAVKLSVVLFYRRIFRGKWFDIWTWFLIAFVSCWTIAFTCSTVFRAGSHFGANWDIDVALLTLKTQKKQLAPLIYFVTDVFTDLLIIVTPIPLIWNLQMSTKKKLSVIGMFFWGALAVVSGLLRLVSWIQRTHGSHFSGTATQSKIVTQITFWVVFELGIDIIAASIPSLGPLLQPKNAPRITSHFRTLRSHITPSSRGHSSNGAAIASKSNASNMSPSKSDILTPPRSAMTRNASNPAYDEKFLHPHMSRSVVSTPSSKHVGDDDVEMWGSMSSVPDLPSEVALGPRASAESF